MVLVLVVVLVVLVVLVLVLVVVVLCGSQTATCNCPLSHANSRDNVWLELHLGRQVIPDRRICGQSPLLSACGGNSEMLQFLAMQLVNCHTRPKKQAIGPLAWNPWSQSG